MSLRAFHIFFIFCAIVLVFGLGIWQYQEYKVSQTGTALLGIAAAFAGAAGLAGYLLWFVNKMKEGSKK